MRIDGHAAQGIDQADDFAAGLTGLGKQPQRAAAHVDRAGVAQAVGGEVIAAII